METYMTKYFLLLSMLLSLFSLNSFARKPAVEPVVGVESESYNPTTVGMEVKYNFGNFIKANNMGPNTMEVSTPQWLAGVTLVSFALLPFMMWFFINKSTQKIGATTEEEETHQTYADTIGQENVASLSDHRSETQETDKEEKKKVA
jgi:hypothetical protein